MIVLSSCSTIGRYQSIRMVKVDKTETIVLDKEKQPEPHLKSEQKQEVNLAQKENSTSEFPEVNIISEDSEIEKSLIQKNNTKEADVEPEVDDENSKIIDQAVRAEKNAIASFILSIAGLITLILPYIGIFPVIVSLILHARANKSRYITPFGEKRLKVSRILLILDILFFIFWTFLVILLIFIF